MSSGIVVKTVGQAETSYQWAKIAMRPNSQRWECRECAKTFSHSSGLWCHSKRCHPTITDQIFKCSECDKQFTLKADFHQHSAQHAINRHLRDYKRRHLSQYRNLPYSAVTPFKGTPVAVGPHQISKFPCDLCGNIYMHPASVEQHKKLEHPVEQDYADEVEIISDVDGYMPVDSLVCPQLFSTQVDLNQQQFDQIPQPNVEIDVVSQSDEISIDPVSMGLSVLIATACEIVQDCADRIKEIMKSMGEANQLDSPMETEFICDLQYDQSETQIHSGTAADPIVIDDELIRPEPSFNPITSAIAHVIQHSTAAGSGANRVEFVGAKLPDSSGFECLLCGRTYVSLRGLLSHSKTHEKSKFPSVQPREICIQPRSLEEHQMLSQSTDGSGKIFICSPQPKSSIDHNKPNPIVERMLRPHKCRVCGESFQFKSDLKIHSYGHFKEAFSCGKCGEQMSRSTDLRRHLKRKYPTEEQLKYKCDSCKKRFAIKGDLTAHLYQHWEILQS